MNKPTKNQGRKQTEIKQDIGFDPCVLADGVAVIFQELKIASNTDTTDKRQRRFLPWHSGSWGQILCTNLKQNISVTFIFNISQMFPDWALS